MAEELRPESDGGLERFAYATCLAVGCALGFGGCAATFSDAKEVVDRDRLALGMAAFGLCVGAAAPYVGIVLGKAGIVYEKIKNLCYHPGKNNSTSA